MIETGGARVRSRWCIGRPQHGKLGDQCRTLKLFKKCNMLFQRCHATKKDMKNCCVGSKDDKCGESPALWQSDTTKKCKREYGPKSEWSQVIEHCAKGWNECDGTEYVECCTRPDGPPTLSQFCALKKLSSKATPDRACYVDQVVQKIKNQTNQIVDKVKELVAQDEENATEVPAAANTTDSDGDGVVDAIDKYPNDKTRWDDDSDGDGVVDAIDKYPEDPRRWEDDTDGDGVPDHADKYPRDSTRWDDD